MVSSEPATSPVLGASSPSRDSWQGKTLLDITGKWDDNCYVKIIVKLLLYALKYVMMFL